jgi:hypothetical protein
LIFKMTRILPLFLLVSCTALFLSCSDGTLGAHAINQPIVRDSAFLHATALDAGGQPVAGAAVTLNFVLLDQNQPSPFPAQKSRAQVSYAIVMEVYDMFDVLVTTVDTPANCVDSTCAGMFPVWDGRDAGGAKALPGLYYTMQTVYNSYTWKPLTTPVRAWQACPGIADTTDAAGRFEIPPLPQTEIALAASSGGVGAGTTKYYKGWISLTFTKQGSAGVTVGTDTVCVFGAAREFTFHPH